LAVDVPQIKTRRYLGLLYTVVGTMRAGAITAGLVEDVQTIRGAVDYNKGYAA
jgi:hypothetical protein